jgi:4-hydroxyisophthalate hydroxylase
LEDSVNLGWKLAAVLQGWGGEALLPSYSQERGPVFRDVAEDFIAARIAKDAEFLARYNPARNRAEFEQAWAARESESENRALSYEPNYEGSRVVFGMPGGVTTAHGKHSLKARAGHHLTPQLLSSGRNVFEELARGLSLLAFGAERDDVRAIQQAAALLAIPLKVIEDSYRDGREAYGSRMVLVRPDQFIAWAGDAAPADPVTLMCKTAGRG